MLTLTSRRIFFAHLERERHMFNRRQLAKRLHNTRFSARAPKIERCSTFLHAPRGISRETHTDTHVSPNPSTLRSEQAMSWNQNYNSEPTPKKSPFSETFQSFFTLRPPRRQTMTKQESKVVTAMFDMIEPLDSEAPDDTKNVVVVDQANMSIKDMLDQKKEQMSLCTDDHQLLEWAAREVFDESTKIEAAAKRSIEEASKTKSKKKQELPALQSPIYPQLVAHLMRTFRVEYRDPHLALQIFNHTRDLSLASYVFGCTTHVYNELIETRWSSFRDLDGVLAAIEEMENNGVPTDRKTLSICENIRRDLGDEELRLEDMADLEEKNVKLWETFSKIEQLLVPGNLKRRPRKDWRRDFDSNIVREDIFDDWSFDTINYNTEKPLKVAHSY